MPKQVGVSVVIPTYNRAELVQEAIASALIQDWDPLEVVVVDDGSTDRTAERLAGLAAKDPRVRLISLECNSGESAARNEGIWQSRYQYVALLDSDNRFLPGKLARQIPALVNARSASASFTGYLLDDGTRERVVSMRAWSQEREQTMLALLEGCCINTSTFVAPRELLQQEPFRTDLACAEDHELWLRLAALGWSFIYDPEPLTWYRQHESGLSADGALVAACSEQVIAEFLKRPDLPRNISRGWRRHSARWSYTSAERYSAAGDRGATVRALWRASTTAPALMRFGWLKLLLGALLGGRRSAQGRDSDEHRRARG